MQDKPKPEERKKRKPTHGNCCTCQTCGWHLDDCICDEEEPMQDKSNRKVMKSTRKDLEKILEHPAMFPRCPDCKKVYDQLEEYISSAVEQARVESEAKVSRKLEKRIHSLKKRIPPLVQAIQDHKTVLTQAGDFTDMLLAEKRTTKEELAKYFIPKLKPTKAKESKCTLFKGKPYRCTNEVVKHGVCAKHLKEALRK